MFSMLAWVALMFPNIVYRYNCNDTQILQAVIFWIEVGNWGLRFQVFNRMLFLVIIYLVGIYKNMWWGWLYPVTQVKWQQQNWKWSKIQKIYRQVSIFRTLQKPCLGNSWFMLSLPTHLHKICPTFSMFRIPLPMLLLKNLVTVTSHQSWSICTGSQFASE